jgi:hypothetical protein
MPYSLRMSNFTVRIEFKAQNEKGFSLEVAARGIRWAIEAAAKEMKGAWPYFVEGQDYFITEVKLNK